MSDEYKNMFWMEGGGSNCFPFSGMNKNQPGWLDKSTILILTWAYSMRFFEVDAVVHECTVRFPEQVLFAIFCVLVDVPKCAFTRPRSVSSSLEQLTSYVYRMVSKIFSPNHIGVPSDRSRKYTGFTLGVWPEQWYVLDFEEFFFKDMVCTCEIYLVAGEHAANQDLLRLRLASSKAKGVDRVIEGSQLTLENAVSASVGAMLESYFVECQRKGLCNSQQQEWTPSVALANLGQSVGFGSIADKSAPALLRKTFLVDLVSRKPVTVEEHLLIQGFPHHCFADLPQELRKYCPDEMFAGISNAEMRSMAGMSMHLAQVGSWVLARLVCTKVS